MMTGKRNHAWKGGISFLPYAPEFNKALKKCIKERDNYQCKECGNTKAKLAVHHIDYNKYNNNHNNLITLCFSCHSKTNFNREEWTQHYQTYHNLYLNQKNIMSTKFTPPTEESSNKEYKIIPAGTHIATCISFVDIGTQPFTYQGEEKFPRKVRISFETPLETAVFKEGDDEKPFMVSTEFTMSFHEKSNLTKMLCSWLSLSAEEVKSVDPEKDLLGKSCLINISHEKTSKGNTFAKIQTVSPLMKGTETPKQLNDSTYFWMGWSGMASEFDEEVFKSLPGFLQDKIAVSPQYIDAHTEKKSPVNKKMEEVSAKTVEEFMKDLT